MRLKDYARNPTKRKEYVRRDILYSTSRYGLSGRITVIHLYEDLYFY